MAAGLRPLTRFDELVSEAVRPGAALQDEPGSKVRTGAGPNGGRGGGGGGLVGCHRRSRLYYSVQKSKSSALCTRYSTVVAACALVRTRSSECRRPRALWALALSAAAATRPRSQ